MMEKKHTKKEEHLIREMMQNAKMEAPENLKYRIMHQIETEKALTPPKGKQPEGNGQCAQ